MIEKFNNILAYLIIISITLIPPIKIDDNLPSIQFLDVLLPFITLSVFSNYKKIEFRKFYVFIIIFSFYILLTILINNRTDQIRDYFEIFKMLKFLIVILFFSITPIKQFKNHVLLPIFSAVVLFNLLHYFNVFNFNEIIELYYNGGIHIQTFGLNSIGLPATKRMMGAIGNPNNNAILFLFFSIIFYPKNEKNKKELLIFFIAIFMFFLCQSRTGFVALFVIILFGVIRSLIKNKAPILKRLKYKPLIIIVAAYLFSYSFSANIIPTSTYISKTSLNGEPIIGADGKYTASYLNSIFNSSVYKSNSVQGRLTVWKRLWIMIKNKPFFGHAPYKEYFYNNKIYAESEYVLMTWRYGFIGLLLYLVLLGQLFFISFKNKTNKYGNVLMMFVIVISITALTNVPLSSRELLVFFGIVIGLFYNPNQSILNEKS